MRRDAGVVERGGLENRCALTSTQGSNPCLSATHPQHWSQLKKTSLKAREFGRLRAAIRHMAPSLRGKWAGLRPPLPGRLLAVPNQCGFPVKQGI